MRRPALILSLLAAGALARVTAAPSPLAAFERELSAIAERATPLVVRVSAEYPDPPAGGYGGSIGGYSGFGGGITGNWPGGFYGGMSGFGNSWGVHDLAPINWTRATTGFLWDRQGHVVMAALPSGSGSPRLFLAGGRQVTGSLGASDPKTMLRVLHTAPADVRPLPLGDSRALKPGALLVVVAAAPDGSVGPYPCVLSGITPDEEPRFRLSAIPGAMASGAPVLNRQGELVAIVTGPAGTEYEAGSAGLAVPIHSARPAIERLVASAPAGYLGLYVGGIPPDVAGLSGARADSGVAISTPLPDTPAAAAGLQVNDIIVEVAGKPVRNPGEFGEAARKLEAGKPVVLTVLRNRERIQVTVTPAPLPMNQTAY